ncbi:hypothetical protein V6N13_096563 [Hibiscus sabdariffa]
MSMKHWFINSATSVVDGVGFTSLMIHIALECLEVHGNESQPARSVIDNASLLQSKFCSASIPRTPTLSQPPPRCKSSMCKVKVNVDRTFLPTTGMATIRGVAHDHAGFVLHNFAFKLSTNINYVFKYKLM